MINELEALLGVLIIIIMIYFFLWRRSKIVGSFTLLFASLSLLIPFGGTDYEMIAWIGIGVCLVTVVAEFAFGKMGKTES